MKPQKKNNRGGVSVKPSDEKKNKNLKYETEDQNCSDVLSRLPMAPSYGCVSTASSVVQSRVLTSSGSCEKK